VTVNPNVPIKDLNELIAYSKANPTKLNYATAGMGTGPHMAGLLFATRMGLQWTYIPSKGGAQATQDVVAGQNDLMFNSAFSTSAFVKTGKLRLLAVSTPKRDPAFPNTPALAEVAPGYNTGAYQAMFVRAGTPPEIVNKLNAEVVRILAAPDIKEKLETLGADPYPSSAEALRKVVHEDRARWAKWSRTRTSRWNNSGMPRPSLVLDSTLQGLAGLGGIAAGAARGGVSGQICAALRRAIVNVDLVPGTALNESDVAEQFGVSRTPVREAFRTLLAEGLLDVMPQKGTSSRYSIAAPCAMRCSCGSAGVRGRAAGRPRAGGGAPHALRIVERQREALRHDDREASLAADEELHRTIMALSATLRPGRWCARPARTWTACAASPAASCAAARRPCSTTTALRARSWTGTNRLPSNCCGNTYARSRAS
jgi:hypothetical protein